MRKSDLEDQIDNLRDVLAEVRELVYTALEPSDETPDAQVEALREALEEIEDLIDSVLEDDDLEDEEDEADEEDEDPAPDR